MTEKKTVRAHEARKTVTKTKSTEPKLEKTRKLTAHGLKRLMERQRKKSV
ncbi:MAG: hypothetical protein KDK48_04430 [Chlamydiia bacterium]|nr:hypothetical protein [Chlamydiia bacterium]